MKYCKWSELRERYGSSNWEAFPDLPNYRQIDCGSAPDAPYVQLKGRLTPLDDRGEFWIWTAGEITCIDHMLEMLLDIRRVASVPDKQDEKKFTTLVFFLHF